MLSASKAYQAAITGDTRRILLQAIIDIIDPDIVYGTVDSSGTEEVCDPAQLHDKVLELAPYATLEHNRWALNGRFRIFPDPPEAPAEQAGFIGDVLSGSDGSFSPAVWVEEQFSSVSILQACSIYFPGDPWDGCPADFTVEVKQGGTAYYTKRFSGNTQRQISLDGFTVNNPDAIRVTVTKWSMPGRRMRVAEIIPGIYEVWDNSIIATFNVVQQANFACLALPYGTCSLSMDNLDRRFEPRNKQGVFLSIEERQGIDVSIGVELPDGTAEYKHVGVYYQYSGGWKTGDNGLTMQWALVDIVGLLADRQYLPPSALPTTLEGWVASVVAQLGANFEGRYTVDPDYAETALTARLEDVTGKSCGEILRMACMAAGVFPRADAETGYLAAEPYWSQGDKMTLDNMTVYPIMQANNDLAAIIFTLADGNNTQYVVSGNSTASSQTVQVQNPFIHDQAAALTAARLILSTYGGNQLAATGRGNPASEIGDVDTVWLNESSATTGRRMLQTFAFADGVMQGCQSTLLQADGSFMFQSRAVITQSGTWTAPAGATQLRIICVGTGQDGTAGTDGSWEAAGVDGVDGAGGKVWAGTVNINPQQQFAVAIGDESVFGQYSSANGQVYPYGYTDIASGDSFARTGVRSPVPGSGDGGAGGAGGVKGNRHTETVWVEDTGAAARDTSGSGGGSIEGGGDDSGASSGGSASRPVQVTVIDNYPTNGTPGVAGVVGCVVVYWDKET